MQDAKPRSTPLGAETKLSRSHASDLLKLNEWDGSIPLLGVAKGLAGVYLGVFVVFEFFSLTSLPDSPT